MLIITKENNSIKVVGQNNPTYPYSGTLVYPLNSVTVVTDQSDMAVFRSALNNDVLFTGLIENITIAGSPVTKENIGTKFGAIANSSSSGGGGTGGGAVDSVNGQTGTVVLTASDVNAYSKAETDEKLRDYTPLEAYATEIASIKTNMGNKADKSSLGDYLLKTEAQSNYETISGAQGKYQAKLTAGTGIEITGENVINVTLDTNIYQVVESLPESEINPNKIYLVLSAESGESDLYIEYLYVNNKWEKIGEYKADVDLTPYLKSSEAASTYATKQELAGEVSEREKQDSALGGMIAGETEAREQAINNLTATVQGKLDTATYNQEKAGFETKEHAEATYQPKGSYLTSIPDEYVTDTELNEKGYATEAWVTEQGYLTEHQDISGLATKEELNGKQNTLVSGTNIKTINSQSLLGEGNIEITVEGGGISDAPSDGKLYGRKNAQWTEVVVPDTSNLATKGELSAKLDTATYNEEKATFALKTEIPDTSDLATKSELSEGLAGKANTSDLSNYLTTANAQSTYATKSELGAKLDVETYNSDKATFALKSEVPTQYVQSFTGTDSGFQILQAGSSEVRGGLTFSEGFTVNNSHNIPVVSIDTETIATKTELQGKQDTLVSGTNIKTVNGNSLLGSGDITIEGSGSDITAKYYPATHGFQLLKDSSNLLTFAQGDNITFKNSGGEDNPLITISANVGGASGIATWDYTQIQSDQEYRTNFLSNVKVSDDLINLGGSDNPEHASILTIDGNVYTVMYNVGGNPKVASINIQDSVATITNIDAIPKNVATTTENGLMSSADKTKLDSIDVESILSRIAALETQMGEVSARLDNINGEVVA